MGNKEKNLGKIINRLNNEGKCENEWISEKMRKIVEKLEFFKSSN